MNKKAGIISLMAILAALLINGAVFAEEVEPPTEPMECADWEETTPSIEAPPEQALEAEGLPTEVIVGQASETTENVLPEAEIVLVDVQGEPLIMASNETSAKLAAPDPYFVVGTTTYRFFANVDVCSTVYPGDPYCFDGKGAGVIQSAVDYIKEYGTIPTDYKIYVESGDYGIADVNIDGSQPFLATINGLIGLNTTGTNPIINGNVNLNALTSGFTLKGFTINGSVSIVNSTGNLLLEDLDVTSTTDSGIKIGTQTTYHPGAAILKDVKSSGNTGKGAQIYAMGNITITNSAFDGNGDDGVFLGTKAGTITINGVSASGNTGTGVRSDEFKKAVTLQQVLVNNNGNGGLSFSDSDGTGALKIDNLYASQNAVSDGVYIETKGAVTVNKVVIDNSGYAGLWISHQTSASPIILSEVSSKNNTDRGIYIDTLGSVTARSIRADENGGTGMEVNNRYQGAVGVITINSLATGGPAAANSFSYNVGGSGLLLRSNKNITLSNLDAMGNGGSGLYAQTDGSLIINKTLPNWYNGFNDNGDHGIYSSVAGSVTLGYVGASYNRNGYGVYFNQSALNVTVTGGFFDGNTYSGLYILSSGNVLLNDVGSAADNDSTRAGYHYGIYIDAAYGTGSVTVRNTSKTGITWISGNSGDGLLIGAKGNVLVNGVFAYDNGGSGINVNNRQGGAVKPVSVSRTQGSWNDGGGLRVFTAGSVTMQDLYMDGNRAEGANINACLIDGGGCLTSANVTLKGYNGFSNNAFYGLQIFTKGAIILGQLDVRENSGGGVYIWNRYPGAVAPVTIGGTSYSSVSGNHGYGLQVESKGLITLKNLSVESNYDLTNSGAVSLSNDDIASTKGVTLVDVQIFGNEKTGLYIRSNGPVALLGVESSYNSIYTGEIDEDSLNNGVIERLSGYWGSQGDEWSFEGELGDSYTITLTSDVFTPMLVLMDEWGNWLEWDDLADDGKAEVIFSPSYTGDYILRVMASGWGEGVYELMFGGTAVDWLAGSAFYGANIYTPSTIRVSSGKSVFSNFDGNNGYGAYFESESTVSVSNAGASGNHEHGLMILAQSNVAIGNNHKTVMSAFNANGASGIRVESGGSITLNNRLWVNGNGFDGIYLSNSGSILKAITLRGVTASGNDGDGMHLDSSGNITLTGVAANGNTEIGVNAQSDAGIFTISGINVFSYNGSTGLTYDVMGSVNISGVTADGNWTNGITGISHTSGAPVLIRSSLLRWNGGDGINLSAQGTITLDGVQSLMNSGDGVDVIATGITTIIKNSAFMGNDGYGIRVLKNFYTITNTFYLANTQGGIYLYS
jgi:hypothetical protein